MSNRAIRFQRPAFVRAMLAEESEDDVILTNIRSSRTKIVRELAEELGMSHMHANELFETLCQEGLYIERLDGTYERDYPYHDFDDYDWSW